MRDVVRKLRREGTKSERKSETLKPKERITVERSGDDESFL